MKKSKKRENFNKIRKKRSLRPSGVSLVFNNTIIQKQVSESTFGFFLEPECFQLESHCSRGAVFSRRLHHRLRLVEWCLVQLHCWLFFGWLVASSLNGSIVLVSDDLYRGLRRAELLLFWCFCHLLHISCRITFVRIGVARAALLMVFPRWRSANPSEVGVHFFDIFLQL